MKCEIEVLSALARIWTDDSAQHGDPYDWTATICRVDHGRYEVMGVDKPIPLSACRAIRSASAGVGAQQVGFVRIKDGREHLVWLPVRSTDGGILVSDGC